MLAKDFKRAIDGEAFGNASEIDSDPGMAIANAIIRKQIDLIGRCRLFYNEIDLIRAARQQTQSLQRGYDGYVENAARATIKFKGGFQNLISPSIHANRAAEGVAVEPAYVALRIVEAHHVVAADAPRQSGNRCWLHEIEPAGYGKGVRKLAKVAKRRIGKRQCVEAVNAGE